MDQEKVSQLIKDIRKQHHLTQRQLAEKYNVTYQAVSKWENGKNMPDIILLKQICKDFDIDLLEVLDSKNTKKKDKRLVLILVLSIIIVVGCTFFLFWYFTKQSDFQFKTLSSDCSDFTISGSIAYNKNKSYIHISNINYCGGTDDTLYQMIECTLYESKNDTKITIAKSECDKKEPIQLETFLKNVEFSVDHNSLLCNYEENKHLFLEINATDEEGKTTHYQIPLNVNGLCEGELN